MNLKEITIEITQQCPNHCVHCSSLSSNYKTYCLSFEKVTELINDAVNLGCKTINLSGGEPFVHPRITQIVDYIFEKGLHCNIYTSGICLIGRELGTVSAKILETLKGKVTKYIVNIESSNEETYAYSLMTVRVESGGYCGDAELDVDLREIAAFARDLRKLYDTLSGEATVREPFGYKRFLSFSAEQRGHILVKGYLCDAMNDHELRFENQFDQTYLRTFSQELVAACSRYQRPE